MSKGLLVLMCLSLIILGRMGWTDDMAEAGTARKPSSDKAANISELQNKIRATATSLDESDQQFAKAEAVKTDLAQKQSLLERQLVQLKDKFRRSRERTSVMEEEIRRARRKLQRMQEDVKAAEGELSQSDARMADAEERLKEVRAKTKASEHQYKERRSAALKNLSSHERESREALMLIEHASRDQAMTRNIASRDQNSVTVKLTRKVASAANAMILSRDCRVRDRAEGGAKPVGVKRAGQQVSGLAGGPWVSFALPDGRTGYLARSCF